MYDDDSCETEPFSACSSLVYTYSSDDASCKYFDLYQGCYDNSACSGKFSIVKTVTASPSSFPSVIPSALPSSKPTFEPTSNPTITSKHYGDCKTTTSEFLILKIVTQCNEYVHVKIRCNDALPLTDTYYYFPTVSPSSLSPEINPSGVPSLTPTAILSEIPSIQPSTLPSSEPSVTQSTSPSYLVSTSPSVPPSSVLSSK